MRLPKEISPLLYFGLAVFAISSYFFDDVVFGLGAYEGCNAYLAAPLITCVGDSILQPSLSVEIGQYILLTFMALGLGVAVIGAYLTGKAAASEFLPASDSDGRNVE